MSQANEELEEKYSLVFLGKISPELVKVKTSCVTESARFELTWLQASNLTCLGPPIYFSRSTHNEPWLFVVMV